MNIQESDLFYDLDEEKAAFIASHFHRDAFQKDEILSLETNPADRFFILVDGEVAVLKTIGTAQRELRRLHPGDSFGEMGLISNSKRSATLKAMRDSECLIMDRKTFLDLMNEDIVFAHRIQQILVERLSHAEEVANHETINSQPALIFLLSQLAESRDPDTVAHLSRVREYCAILADRLSQRLEYMEVITPDFIENIYIVSPLHDIGKVAIPDSILLKAGRLSAEEFSLVKTHTQIGAESLQLALRFSEQDMFRMAHDLTLWHHERHDGQGYPDGLYGDQIPLEARIMSIVDVYDALVSRRVYKPPYGRDETYWAIQHLAGKKFDPIVAETMLGCIDEFEKVYQQHTID